MIIGFVLVKIDNCFYQNRDAECLYGLVVCVILFILMSSIGGRLLFRMHREFQFNLKKLATSIIVICVVIVVRAALYMVEYWAPEIIY